MLWSYDVALRLVEAGLAMSTNALERGNVGNPYG